MRISDWSSDVCSSDLLDIGIGVRFRAQCGGGPPRLDYGPALFRVGGVDQFGAGRGRGQRRSAREGKGGPPCEVPHISPPLDRWPRLHGNWSFSNGLAWPIRREPCRESVMTFGDIWEGAG